MSYTIGSYMQYMTASGEINPDMIIRIDSEDGHTRTYISSANYAWDDYEAWLADGNEPLPYEPIIFPRT